VKNFAYAIDSLDVVRFRATQGDGTEEHVTWRVGYAPETVLTDEGSWVRIVIGTLHAGGEGGWAEVDAGAFLVSQEEHPETDSDFEDLIRESMAVEALYDFARSHLRTFLATISVSVDLPWGSPEPELLILNAPDDEDEATESPDHSGTADA